MTVCPNPWRCHNEDDHTPPKGCVHHASSGMHGDAEAAGDGHE